MGVVIKLGKVRSVYQGDWQEGISYEILDLVQYNGAVWQAKINVPAGMPAPAAGSPYWFRYSGSGSGGGLGGGTEGGTQVVEGAVEFVEPPTAPTPPIGDVSDKLATTEYVNKLKWVKISTGSKPEDEKEVAKVVADMPLDALNFYTDENKAYRVVMIGGVKTLERVNIFMGGGGGDSNYYPITEAELQSIRDSITANRDSITKAEESVTANTKLVAALTTRVESIEEDIEEGNIGSNVDLSAIESQINAINAEQIVQDDRLKALEELSNIGGGEDGEEGDRVPILTQIANLNTEVKAATLTATEAEATAEKAADTASDAKSLASQNQSNITALQSTVDKAVLTEGDQVIGGTKTFTSALNVPNSIAGDHSERAANTDFVTTAISNALDRCVRLKDEQDISGVKTFTESPVVPTAKAGDNSQKAANTAFVQNSCATIDKSLTDLSETVTTNQTQSTNSITGMLVEINKVLEMLGLPTVEQKPDGTIGSGNGNTGGGEGEDGTTPPTEETKPLMTIITEMQEKITALEEAVSGVSSIWGLYTNDTFDNIPQSTIDNMRLGSFISAVVPSDTKENN